MVVDPRTPVIVGISQITHHDPAVDGPHEAVDLMADATAAALKDAGLGSPRTGIDTVGVCAGLTSHPNPAGEIETRLGLDLRRRILTTWGGQTPIAFIGHLAAEIAAGRSDGAVMVGGEANASRDLLRANGQSRPRSPSDGEAGLPPEPWGAPLEMGSAIDTARGGEHPRNNYAVVHSATRHARGETLDAARDRIAALWAGYAAVAATNPHAVDRRNLSIEQIRTPTPDNRMVAWPFTKAMCANNRVDQAGAVVLLSTAAADRAGIEAGRRIYLHETLNAVDTDSLLPRAHLAEVPALRAAATHLRARWGDLNGLEHIDLYGCFPSIAALTLTDLALDPSRPLTVTGGLGFMGAPLNFAAGQSLIGMVERLRAEPGTRGLVQGNGGQAAKHAFGIYSTHPTPWRDPETIERRELAILPADPNADGPITVDGVTVEFDHGGPTRAVAVVRLQAGGRMWAVSDDPAVMRAATSTELVGTTGAVKTGVFRI